MLLPQAVVVAEVVPESVTAMAGFSFHGSVKSFFRE